LSVCSVCLAIFALLIKKIDLLTSSYRLFRHSNLRVFFTHYYFADFAKAALKLKEHGVFLAKVDVTKEVELAKEYFVQGYPTLIIFKHGEKFQDYTGDRSAEAIVNYMMALNDPNYVPPPSAVVTCTGDTFNKLVKAEKLSLVMFYAPWCKHCKQVFPGMKSLPIKKYLNNFYLDD
jgi:thioredoxin-like negative regulator of GroEL